MQYQMKHRILALLVTIYTLASFAGRAEYATTVYTIPELSMKIEIPSDWIVFTRQTPDPAADNLKQRIYDYVRDERNNVYFIAYILYDDSIESYLQLVSDATRIPGIVAVKNLELDDIFNRTVDVSAFERFDNTRIVKNRTADFVAFDTILDNRPHKMYNTIVNEKPLRFSLVSYVNEFPDSVVGMVEHALETIEFTIMPLAEYETAFEEMSGFFVRWWANTTSTFRIVAVMLVVSVIGLSIGWLLYLMYKMFISPFVHPKDMP